MLGTQCGVKDLRTCSSYLDPPGPYKVIDHVGSDEVHPDREVARVSRR